MKDLILIRGLPGSGKTTIAEILQQTRAGNFAFSISTDEFWEEQNNGHFDPELLDKAHEWTEDRVEEEMAWGSNPIIVHNTFTQPWEWQAYEEFADEYNYRVHYLICEKRHDGESTSDVPQRKIDDMESRFQIRLQ